MKRHWRIVLLFSAAAIYLSGGAALFTLIEGPHEIKTREHLAQTVAKFELDNPSLDHNKFKQFLKEIMQASREGVFIDLSDNNATLMKIRVPMGLDNWHWPNSFFFATTVITTIGYGNLTPSTRLGRSVCILFAFIGIPIMAWLLAEVGIQCKSRGKRLADRLDRCLSRFIKKPKIRNFIKITILGSLAYTNALLLPAAVYKVTQGWDYSTAHYFCFITLSTIGFGDVVPEFSKNKFYLCTSLYLVYGLAVIAIVLNIVQQIQRKQATKLFKYCSARGNQSNSTRSRHDNGEANREDEVQNSAPTTSEPNNKIITVSSSTSDDSQGVTRGSISSDDKYDGNEDIEGGAENKICKEPSNENHGLLVFETSM